MLITRARLSGIVAALVLASNAPAATFVVPHDRVMVQNTSTIVIASCLASRAELTLDDRIETISTFSVEEVIKGSLQADTFDVREPGGVVDNRETFIPGSPRFQDGTHYLLFLLPSGDIWTVRDLGGYTDAMASGVVIKAIHFQEIRTRVK